MADTAGQQHGEQNHIPEYDGVRGVAISMVIIWHCINNLIADKHNLVSKFILLVTGNFWSGVDLFFVLSGFLLGSILLKQRGSKNYFKTFYLRRICRIFPLYYCYLIIYYLLLHSGVQYTMPWVFSNTLPFWSYASFTQNILMAKYFTLGSHAMEPTWSLAVEEQFYLLLPLVIFFLRGKKLLLLVVIASAAALYFRLTAANWIASFASLHTRADALLLGVLAAYLSTNQLAKQFAENHLGKLYMLCYAMLGLFFAGSFRMITINYYLNFSLLSIFYSLVIVLISIDKKSWLVNFLQNKALGHIGRISFGIYIYHYFILGVVHYLLLHEAPQISTITNLLVTLLALLVLYLFSFLSYHLFEKKIIAFGHRYVY